MQASTVEDTALSPQGPQRRRALEPRRGVRRLVSRVLFGGVALIASTAALLFHFVVRHPDAQARDAAALTYAMLALVSLLALRTRGQAATRASFGVLALAVCATSATAGLMGWGLMAPGLAFQPLFVLVLCIATSARAGLALAALTAVFTLALAIVVPLPAGAGLPTLPLLLAERLAQLVLALVGGIIAAGIVQRYLGSADDREQRFRGLLAIVADAYWEIDAQYHLVAARNQHDESSALDVGDGLGQAPWDLSRFAADGETLDVLLADLDARQPFRDRLVHWRHRNGRVRALMVSGEPRFDERGVFKGFWGVARDVTAEVAAQRALAVTETRYQELFARIPTPLVLHREGRVLDANPAALRLFGFADEGEIAGRDLLALYEGGDSRERERRRLEELEAAEPGTALPVADFRLLPRDGRRVAAHATAVRVEDAGGTATLSIYVDDTERLAAEEAVRRSEAMLSHLVETSPDVITLTDMANGRYAMVNRTFERVTGYSAEEVIGRTSFELGIWRHLDERTRFVEAIRRDGIVTEMPAHFTAKRGGTVAMLISGARFAMDRREYLVINARDVTAAERTRLEREAVLENASVGIAFTRDQQFVIANPRFEQMMGWPHGALAGQLGTVVWPDEAAYAEVGAQVGPALARGEAVEFERELRRFDGSRFLARLQAKAIDPAHPAQGGTIWIVEDVTERRQFEQALAAARDAAEAASRAKSAFLANTSHELRTPLNGLLHLAELAREEPLPEGRRRQYLDQIVDSARMLAAIISDILDLSKIEAGRLAIESTAFDLGALLAGLQRAHAAPAAAKGLALGFDIGEGVAGAVTGDALRVRQILVNFLGNALKFTPQGRVDLRARRSGERVRFEVHDSGPGVDEATQQRLFTPFTQGDESTTRRFGGTGLGLSICRELAHLMGGEVGLSSGSGSGSCFWADLPLPASDSTPAPEPEPEAADAPVAGMRVLMVEDNPVNMMVAVAILERWGVVVEQASEGRQALEAVQRAADAGRPFEAVLMDVQMPVMSGYEATRALRRCAAGAQVPVIALTAAALVSERERALEAGMDDFLTKPIDADRLRTTLARWRRRGG